jgi:hypothetical protein
MRDTPDIPTEQPKHELSTAEQTRDFLSNEIPEQACETRVTEPYRRTGYSYMQDSTPDVEEEPGPVRGPNTGGEEEPEYADPVPAATSGGAFGICDPGTLKQPNPPASAQTEPRPEEVTIKTQMDDDQPCTM